MSHALPAKSNDCSAEHLKLEFTRKNWDILSLPKMLKPSALRRAVPAIIVVTNAVELIRTEDLVRVYSPSFTTHSFSSHGFLAGAGR